DRLPLATKKKWFWSTPVCRNVHLPMDVYSQPSPDDVHCYLAFLFENPQSIASFFNILSDPESYPLSYHCYAGKDRTGIMTALLLELLGTPRPVIYSDFLYSRCRDMEVCSPDLDRIFAAIDYKYGGIEPFLTGLGVSAEKLHKIPEIVVEPAPQKP
ncbi:tyrosine-protein phosphatase, partial [bacterium]|nr:tyrosine-protein phosphatase [bacterium]